MKENLLPSYVVFRVLAKAQVTIEEILKQFIASYIKDFRLYRFTISVLEDKLNKYYGFKLPAAIIKSVVSNFENIRIDRGHYAVSVETIEKIYPVELDKYRIETDELIIALIDFSEKKLNRKFTKKEIDELKTEFIKYFSSSTYTGKYKELISSFGLSLTTNSPYYDVIQKIQYGSIIYKGITSDTDPDNLTTIEYWNTELNLYLDMEILFDICGYNGSVYKQYADDFLSLVDEINKNKKYINLKYFRSTKKEINTYFKSAKKVILYNSVPETTAMEYLVNKGKDDVGLIEERALFNKRLSDNNIELDISFKYDTNDSESEDNDIDYSGERYSEDYVNYIYKLRDENNKKSFREIKYIFITGTNAVINKSMDITRTKGGGVPLALYLENIISRFWFILNKGFGQDGNIESFDFINRCRIVYSKTINDQAMEKIKETRELAEKSKLSDKDAIHIIAEFKNQISTPEKITQDKIIKYEKFKNTSVQQIQQQLLLKEEEHESLKRSYDNLVEKDSIKEKELLELREFKKARLEQIENRKILIKNILYYFIYSILYLMFFGLIGIGCFYLGKVLIILICKFTKVYLDSSSYVSTLISALLALFGIIISLFISFKKMNIVKLIMTLLNKKLFKR